MPKGEYRKTRKRRNTMNDNQFLITLILIVVALYIISPLDLVPGPIDDVILAIVTLLARKRLTSKEEKE